MSERVDTKPKMYRLLASGRFGNTVQQWFDLHKWETDPQRHRHALWGIRSGLAGGDKRMRLNVPTEEVSPLYREWFPGGGGNISPMIDRYAVLRAEVWESHIAPHGLGIFAVLPGCEIDKADPWRGSFRRHGRAITGVNARAVLRQNLWPSDYEDLMVLLDDFPGHVVEISACNRAVGVIPNRNTIVWEVRAY